MKRVVITGAQGFIGRRLVDYFLDKGYIVSGWGREDSGLNEPWFRKVDMENSEKVEKELKTDCPDIIIHCAGSANVGESVLFPERDFTGNVLLTHNLLVAMHRLGLNHVRVVFLSSAAVYGNPSSLPISEEMALNPLSPYAMHKILCEDICRYYIRNYNMNIKIARIFSAYGRGLKKQIFWDMYQKYLKTDKLEMFGTGQESRDYIHIDDLAKAICLIATTDSEHILFNVANGRDISIRHVTECFADCINIDRAVISFNGVVREGDPLNWRADISRLEQLGYCQTIEIREGLLDYVKWLKNNS